MRRTSAAITMPAMAPPVRELLDLDLETMMKYCTEAQSEVTAKHVRVGKRTWAPSRFEKSSCTGNLDTGRDAGENVN